MKSDAYIKDREAKLVELEAECQDITRKYQTFDKRFSDEQKRCDSIQKSLDKQIEAYNELTKKNKRMRSEIIDYEQRYRGIDVGKIHE